MRGFRAYVAQELKIYPGRDYQIVRASNEPRLLNVQVAVNPRHLRPLVKICPELAMATGLHANQQLRISRSAGTTIALELPKPQGLWFNIRPGHLPQRRGLRASVGLDTTRAPAAVNFGDPLTPHALVAGATGSGKTMTQQLLAWSLAHQNSPADVRLIIIDVEKRGYSWRLFDGLEHLSHPVVIDEPEARRVFSWAVAELDRRQQQHRNTPRTFVFVDELRSLIEAGGFTDQISRVTRIGREYGIHFIGATQHPTIDVLGDADIKRNLTTRLVGRVDDATAAHVATGQRATGAETLTGSGDFLLVQPGHLHRITVALLDDRDADQLPRAGRPHCLDLDGLDDPAHILDQTSGPRADDLSPAHIARALVEDCGITKLAGLLGIGSSKAKRVNEFAGQVRDGIIEAGYQITMQDI